MIYGSFTDIETSMYGILTFTRVILIVNIRQNSLDVATEAAKKNAGKSMFEL
jgi:hypothetical protein